MRGVKRGTIAAAMVGGAAALTGCDRENFDCDMDEIIREQDTLYITDANVQDYQGDIRYSAKNYKNVKISINNPQNLLDALMVTWNLSMGQMRISYVRLEINIDDPMRLVDQPNTYYSMIVLQDLVALVAGANYGFDVQYKHDYSDDRFNFSKDWRRIPLKQGQKLDLAVAFRTVDLTNLGFMISEKSAIEPLVDMVQILQSAGFTVKAIDNYTRLKQALAETPNPYQKATRGKSDLYISAKMMAKAR